ncbi:MAG: diaminopimelate dehydrogenase [Brachymonas sp.]|nr:diaminopimelate dehydrogenase [Brachymonas sp.]
MQKIRIGIAGYGNLGRGVQASLAQNPDMELAGVFSRRALDAQQVGAPCMALDAAKDYRDQIDVMILCGGSAHDLPQQTPELAQWFNTVDSFDNHSKIPEHFAAVDQVAKAANTVALVAIGWDPGLFSLNRLLGEAVLPEGKTYTFWGKGLSQGHSDAIRRVAGVAAGVQYTLPDTAAMDAVRRGEAPALTMYNSHRRECFVEAEEGADRAKIEHEIKTMPGYFANYDTTVHFIDRAELDKNHAGMGHGGFVIRSGTTGEGTHQVTEFALKLGSNPEFTSSVLVAYARAAFVMRQMGQTGAKTLFDVAPGWLSPKPAATLRKELL